MHNHMLQFHQNVISIAGGSRGSEPPTTTTFFLAVAQPLKYVHNTLYALAILCIFTEVDLLNTQTEF